MAKILLVEDENVINMAMQYRVEGMGHSVCGTAATGQQAIDQAGSKQPDVIIMDISLKGKMDGIEAAARIRDQFGIPVIYLTAYGDEETRKRAKSTNPVAYLVKTFEDVALQSAIEQAVLRGRELRTRDPQEPATCSIETQPGLHGGDDTVRPTTGVETQR